MKGEDASGSSQPNLRRTESTAQEDQLGEEGCRRIPSRTEDNPPQASSYEGVWRSTVPGGSRSDTATRESEEEAPRQAASSSTGGYGSNQRMREPPMVQVNVNVINNGGPQTPIQPHRRSNVSEPTDSEFEFITP